MNIRQIILAAMVFVLPAFCEHQEFLGTWQLDAAKSTFGPMAPFDSAVLTVDIGSHKRLHMQVVAKGSHLERTVDMDWKVDDRFHPVVGDEPGALLAKWEGSALVGTRDTEGGMETIRMMPSPDGTSLVETIQSSRGLTTLFWRRR